MFKAAEPSDTVIALLIERARAGEPDRYVAALLAPRAIQRDLLCLTAFLADLGAIPSSVSEPMIGEMRLQWWRDALAGVGSGARTGNPIADEFLELISRRRLPLELLIRIVDARSHDLTGEMHADDAALARYYCECEGLPFAIAAMIMGQPAWPEKLVTSAGMAYGLSRALGRLPALIHNGGFPIPQQTLDEAGIEPGTLVQAPFSLDLHAAIKNVAGRYEHMAGEALRATRSTLGKMQPLDQIAALPLAMVEPYFAAQRKSGYKHLEHVVEILPLRRIWQVARTRYLQVN